MRLRVLLHAVAAAALAVLALLAPAEAQPPATAARVPVVVELFTSEGCSSCPPADDVLGVLVKEQPIEGVEVIGLGFHVDYWDQLGWRDRFASRLYTARQNRYASAIENARTYTPQMVVDGAAAFVGSDRRAAALALTTAAKSPKASVAVSSGQAPDGKARTLTIEVEPGSAVSDKAEIFLAITEDGLQSDVLRGENAEKTLRHDAVVRTFDKVGTIEAPGKVVISRRVSPGRGWALARLKAVVIVQESKSRRIVGAAAAAL
jgi:hypothetical protein